MASAAGRVYGWTVACRQAVFGQTYRYCCRYSPMLRPGFHACHFTDAASEAAARAGGKPGDGNSSSAVVTTSSPRFMAILEVRWSGEVRPEETASSL